MPTSIHGISRLLLTCQMPYLRPYVPNFEANMSFGISQMTEELYAFLFVYHIQIIHPKNTFCVSLAYVHKYKCS